MSTPAPDTHTIPSHNWRRSPHIRERLLKVAGLRQRGLTQAQIAVKLRVSRPTISRDLTRLQLLWRQEHTNLVNAERLRSLAALRETERLCWSLIDRHHTDADHIADVTAAARTCIAVQREIRQLLASVRPRTQTTTGATNATTSAGTAASPPSSTTTSPHPMRPPASDPPPPPSAQDIATFNQTPDHELIDMGLTQSEIDQVRASFPDPAPRST